MVRYRYDAVAGCRHWFRWLVVGRNCSGGNGGIENFVRLVGPYGRI